MKFTKEEIEWMKKNCHSPRITNGEIGKSLWFRAFDFYNKNNEAKLGMSCAPCYFKVIGYIIKMHSAKPPIPDDGC